MNCLQITPDKQFIAAAGNPHVRLFEVGGNANPNPVGGWVGAARLRALLCFALLC